MLPHGIYVTTYLYLYTSLGFPPPLAGEACNLNEGKAKKAVLMVSKTIRNKRIDRVVYGGKLETYLVNIITSVRIGYSL